MPIEGGSTVHADMNRALWDHTAGALRDGCHATIANQPSHLPNPVIAAKHRIPNSLPCPAARRQQQDMGTSNSTDISPRSISLQQLFVFCTRSFHYPFHDLSSLVEWYFSSPQLERQARLSCLSYSDSRVSYLVIWGWFIFFCLRRQFSLDYGVFWCKFIEFFSDAFKLSSCT